MKIEMMRTLVLFVACTVAGTAAAYSQGPSPPRTNGEIYNSLDDKCLQPANNSIAQFAPLVMEVCDVNNPAQKWKSVFYSNSTHYVNQLSGFCMDAFGKAVNHTPVLQGECKDISNERWSYSEQIGATEPTVVSEILGAPRNTYFCLDLPGGQTGPGIAVQIYSCNGTASQQWFTP
jgi:hypothetical protein